MDSNTRQLFAIVQAKGRFVKVTQKKYTIQLHFKSYQFMVELKKLLGGSISKNGNGYNWTLANKQSIKSLNQKLLALYGESFINGALNNNN